MLNLMKGVFGPSISYQDKVMYMTSLGLNHSIGSDKNAKNPACVDQILNLITSSNTRYLGLQLLELALQQNFDNIYNKGRWAVITYGIIKESRAANLEKIQACKILSMIIPYMADNPSSDAAKDEFVKDIFTVLLQKIDEQVEWAEDASKCIQMALKTFPKDLSYYQGVLLNTILSQASSNVSSKSFEVLAECFCELPYCSKDSTAESVRDRWKELYLRTVKTIESIQMACFSRMTGIEPYDKLGIDLKEFIFKEESSENNFFPAFVKRVRRFVNLCKCLAKLLSIKPRYPMKVPVTITMKCLIPLFTSWRKEKVTSSDEEIFCTFVAQMRLASLVVLESLILNCNLLKESLLIRDLMKMSLQSSNAYASSEPVSELRVATWKLISLWLDGYGRKVSKEIAGASELTEEILIDINIDAMESLQASDAIQANNKSKKNASLESTRKSVLKRNNQLKVCEAALNSLESLLCTGILDIPKGIFQEICKRVFKICDTIHSTCDPIPFPYNDESCREKLYSVVLTIAAVLKPDEFQILQNAIKILARITNDPSFKVRKLSNKVPVVFKLQFYPKRPLPPCSDNKQRRVNASNDMLTYEEWSSAGYTPNAKIVPASEASENVNVEQSFQNDNETEINSEAYMEVESDYREQIIENQCNGEDLSEIQNSSQCQDDIESDEEEEEEEDEERSYGDEEVNQEENLHNPYIPASRKSPLPLQINTETVQSITEPEYEDLTPCIKVEDSTSSTNNKEKCVNGEDSVMHDEQVPSSSVQVTNENGIFGMDDDDLDEENEEEEEENETIPTDKRTESYDPPPKRQKVEAKDDDNEVDDDDEEKVKSPSLDEIKDDFVKFIEPSIEDVSTGKVQLSTS